MQLDVTDKTCATSLKLLGDYWTLRIIDVLEDGKLRFCDLQRASGDVNPVTLTTRLKRLEEAALVRRVVGTEDGCSVTYQLTSRGQEVLPVIAAINTFAGKSQTKQAVQSGGTL